MIRLRPFLVGLVVGLGVLAISAPVAAQWTGSRIGQNAKKKDPDAVMRVTAECIAARGPAYAYEILDALPGSEEEFRIIRRNEGDISLCMGSSDKLAVGGVEMAFTARGLRPMLAEELLRREFLQPVATASLSAGDAWFLPQLAMARDANASADYAYLSYLEFGDCVVAGDPASALDFLKAEPDSQAASKALGELMPALSPCISNGETLELTAKSLRFALTEPALHRIRATETTE